jgi:hypothetical protein
MNNLQYYLINTLLLSELIAALVGVWKNKKFRNNYLKWFIYYLVFIFTLEIISDLVLVNFLNIRKYYYDFFVIPLEFIFLFWLYSYKSLQNKKLFWGCTVVYLISFLPQAFIFDRLYVISSFNYVSGTFLLSLMVLLEFNKQIRKDYILSFKENMMFYVNIGISLMYVGTLPFFSFYDLISSDHEIWFRYYIFFMITNIIMYILFTFALLWGKPNTYSSR